MGPLLYYYFPSPGPSSSSPVASGSIAPHLLYYFFGTLTGPEPPSPVLPRRDGDGYAAILDILRATGEFQEVTSSKTQPQEGIAAEAVSWAHLQMMGARTRPDGNADREYREPFYRLWIEVRLNEDADPYQATDRIEAAVRNALIGRVRANYGGFCLPDKAMLGDSRVDFSAWPSVKIALDGRFGYVVDVAAEGYRSSS